MTDEIVWEPRGYYAEESNVARFMSAYGYDDYADLIPGTEADLARIWGEMTEDVDVVWREPYETVIDTSHGVEFASWYADGRLNAVETILDRWVERAPERAMYVWETNEATPRGVPIGR